MPSLPATIACHPYRSSQSKPIASTSCCLSQILSSSRCPNISRTSLISLDAFDARRHHHLPLVPLTAAQTDLLYLTPPHSDIVHYSLPQLSSVSHLRLLIPPLHATTTICHPYRLSQPKPIASTSCCLPQKLPCSRSQNISHTSLLSLARHHRHLPPVPRASTKSDLCYLTPPHSDIVHHLLPQLFPERNLLNASAARHHRDLLPVLLAAAQTNRLNHTAPHSDIIRRPSPQPNKSPLHHDASFRYCPPHVASTIYSLDVPLHAATTTRHEFHLRRPSLRRLPRGSPPLVTLTSSRTSPRCTAQQPIAV